MAIFETFHKLVKLLTQGRTNGKYYEQQCLNNFLCRTALLNLLPSSCATAPPAPLACLALPKRLESYPWGAWNSSRPPPLSKAALPAAWVSLGILPPHPPNFEDLIFHKKAHLTRANGSILLANTTLNSDTSVVRLCARDPSGDIVFPYRYEGDEIDMDAYERVACLYLILGFFSLRGHKDKVFAVASPYFPYQEGSAEAQASPYTFRSRRLLNPAKVVVFGLDSVYSEVLVAHFTTKASTPKSMADITFCAWMNASVIM